MDNNDLMRRLRYALKCDDQHTAHLVGLGGGYATNSDAAGWRERDDAEAFKACGSADVVAFLDGLIIDMRGPREEPAPSPWPTANKPIKPVKPTAAANDMVDNNLVLKQLRIALSLRSDNLHQVLVEGGSSMSKSEASALFRNPDARNFRTCGDQVLRQFLNGLAKRRAD